MAFSDRSHGTMVYYTPVSPTLVKHNLEVL